MCFFHGSAPWIFRCVCFKLCLLLAVAFATGFKSPLLSQVRILPERKLGQAVLVTPETANERLCFQHSLKFLAVIPPDDDFVQNTESSRSNIVSALSVKGYRIFEEEAKASASVFSEKY